MPERKSRTDWERVKREAAAAAAISYDREDGPYDPNDEQAVDRYWDGAAVRGRGERGPQKSPTKEMISIRLSREVLDYFRGTGEGWQSRIDDTLKRVVARKKR
jgi:uncharacterized protein (DUF4415 family)